MIVLANDVIRLASTLTATSTAAGFDVNNLKNDRRSSSWRSTAISTQTITLTWASPVAIDFVGLAFTNFLVGSTFRVRLFTNTGDSTPIADSGVQTVAFVYPPPAGFDANNLASFAFGGGNYASISMTQHSVRKMEVLLTNPSGIDAFIELARIVAGIQFSPANGIDNGAAVSSDDLSTIYRSDGGDAVIDRRPMSKAIRLNLSLLPHSDRAALRSIIRRNGSHTPVYVSVVPYNTESLKSDFSIYGYFENVGGLSLDSSKYSSASVQISEI